MDWIQCTLLVLLAYSVATVSTSPVPRAAIHVKYFAPAHVYSGAFYSSGAAGVGRNALGSDPEAMWPMGVFLPPDNWLSSLQTQVFPSSRQPFPLAGGGGDYDDDPLLARGEAAAAVVKALVSGGEMFYSLMPHARALLRVQEIRRLNGLPPLRMGSNRPDSPFYLWAKTDPRPRRTFVRNVRHTPSHSR